MRAAASKLAAVAGEAMAAVGREGTAGVGLLVLMGITGVGKSTVGRILADALQWSFHDADELFSPIAPVGAGGLLDVEDAEPWLSETIELLDDLERRGERAVVACSALRRGFREELLSGRQGAVLVHLSAPSGLLRARLESRAGRFLPLDRFERQLAMLEPPGDALEIDASGSPREVAAAIVERLRREL